MLALGPDVKEVTISAQRVQTVSPLSRRVVRVETLTLDGVHGQHHGVLRSILENEVGLKELYALLSEPLEDKHIRLMSDDVYDDERTMKILTTSPSSPIKFWGCEETLTRLEIVVECTFTKPDDEVMSLESRSEHSVVYG